MKKWLKIALIVLGVGITGYLIWWYFTKKKSGGNGNLGTIPATEKPPSTQLLSTTDGPGKAGIDRRRAEILSSSAYLPIQDEVRRTSDIFMGLSAGTGNLTQRFRDWIGTDEPYNLSEIAKNALRDIKAADPNGGYNTMKTLYENNKALKAACGKALVGNYELESQENFNRQLICQFNQNCGNNYSRIDEVIKFGASNVYGQMNALATNWLHNEESFQSLVTAQAIADLRAAGWRFTGYDF